MFHTPDYFHNVSLKLSGALDDIGVNEGLVIKRRRRALMFDTMMKVSTSDGRLREYLLGSQSEGSTTLGLCSDQDILRFSDLLSAMQEWSEWTPGCINLLMIQDEIPPGYCRLQMIRPDVPLPVTYPPSDKLAKHMVRDIQGRLLLKNTFLETLIPEGLRRQGPAFVQEGDGIVDQDFVPGISCKSWPKAAEKWINHQEQGDWPTEGMKRYAVRSESFVVGTGSKISECEDSEWRISTCMAERCLMMNLNITQIRCYVLMKMITKTYINSPDEKLITSFMCKNVMFHCIKYCHSSIWKEYNILNCLTYCILTLKRCVSADNCPHFIICGNNLMAGKFSKEIKNHLLNLLSNIIKSNGFVLLGIPTDNLGHRLQLKLNVIHQVQYSLPSAASIDLYLTLCAFIDNVLIVGRTHEDYLSLIAHTGSEIGLHVLVEMLLRLIRQYRDGNILEKKACRLMVPLLCTTTGSVLASYTIQHDHAVSPRAFALMSAGLNSDVASSRLKLASVFYCTGDMERAELVLRDTEEQYDIIVENVCTCYVFKKLAYNVGFATISTQLHEEEALRRVVAFCVRFLPSEINCVPHELQYEMFRSTPEERLLRRKIDKWMDLAVVDSLPFMYFLKYKTYGHLRRLDDQQRALNKLVHVTYSEMTLAHRETALNLLGQCLEQENRSNDALHCYVLSLNVRPRNNVAIIHICKLFANAV